MVELLQTDESRTVQPQQPFPEHFRAFAIVSRPLNPSSPQRCAIALTNPPQRWAAPPIWKISGKRVAKPRAASRSIIWRGIPGDRKGRVGFPCPADFFGTAMQALRVSDHLYGEVITATSSPSWSSPGNERSGALAFERIDPAQVLTFFCLLRFLSGFLVGRLQPSSTIWTAQVRVLVCDSGAELELVGRGRGVHVRSGRRRTIFGVLTDWHNGFSAGEVG